MAARTIDEVIIQLDDIIARSRLDKSRLGFFATLYRNVTLQVREGIRNNLFEDGERMERLDVTFANRYLTAYESYRAGQTLSSCWMVSFRAAARWPPIILQHLLLGMNAHINYDLGIAAAETAPGVELPSLQHDFNQINNILASMVSRVRSNIEELSPWINFIDRHVGLTTENRVINFSMGRARDSAWGVAVMLNSSGPEQRAKKLLILDKAVADFGHLVSRPGGVLINAGLWLIRLRESNDIPHTIDVLSQM
jgi:hypothetical protein